MLIDLPKIRFKLTQALTTYDRKQSAKRSYNPYALGQYFDAVDRTLNDVLVKNLTLEQSLNINFSDRVLDVCLKAIK